jgi:DNA-binding NarL/FixJ family response regulator
MQKNNSKIQIGIVDDHHLFTKSLALLINGFLRFEIVLEASHGKDLQKKLQQIKTSPEILLIDVNMPVMDGQATALWLREKYPNIKLVALSMNDEEDSIIRMFRAGCCAYLFKDIHPKELEKALDQVHKKGYFNPESHGLDFQQLFQASVKGNTEFSQREREFLKLACSELTYKEISQKMDISEHTVDGYREMMFKKLNVTSRTSMVLKALRKKIIKF